MLGVVLGGGSMPGYLCPVTDRFVTSRRERRNIMAEHGLIEAGDRSSNQRDRRGVVTEKTKGETIDG